MGTPPCFGHFIKGDNFHKFLFAYQYDKTLPKKRTTPKGENLLLQEQILPFKSFQIERGGKNMNVPELLP